jgi:hypothetical protein
MSIKYRPPHKTKDSISYYQDSLGSLLENIKVKDRVISKEHFKLKDTYKNTIYDISETKKDLDIEKYKTFLQFIIQELEKNNTEFLQNKGEILTTHIIDNVSSEDKQEIEKIRKKYEDIYNLSTLQKDKTPEIQTQIQSRLDKLYLTFKPKDIEDISNPRQINYDGKVYPNWLEDLLSVSKTSLYELKEDEINIPNILEQNDTQFIDTLKERVKGLKKV